MCGAVTQLGAGPYVLKLTLRKSIPHTHIPTNTHTDTQHTGHRTHTPGRPALHCVAAFHADASGATQYAVSLALIWRGGDAEAAEA
eukprot:361574-Chlamydomonas_euryale.AAC.9